MEFTIDKEFYISFTIFTSFLHSNGFKSHRLSFYPLVVYLSPRLVKLPVIVMLWVTLWLPKKLTSPAPLIKTFYPG